MKKNSHESKTFWGEGEGEGEGRAASKIFGQINMFAFSFKILQVQ